MNKFINHAFSFLPLKLFLIFLKVLDVGTTAYVVEHFGSHRELNPVVRHLIESIGSSLTMVVIFLIYSFAVFFINKRFLLIICAVLMSLVVINNFIVIFCSTFSS